MKKTLLEQIIREELHSVHEQLGAVVPVKPTTPVKPTKPTTTVKPKKKGTVVKTKKVVLPPIDTIFHTGNQVTSFRNWMKQTHQAEWSSKLKNLRPNEPQEADVEMYVKYKTQYAAYLKKYNKIAPDDESIKKAEEAGEIGGSWVTHGITAITWNATVVALTGVGVVTILGYFIKRAIARRKAAQSASADLRSNKSGTGSGKYKGWSDSDKLLGFKGSGITLFMQGNAWKMVDALARNPKVLKAEIDKLKAYNNKQLRSEIIAVTDHIPTEQELNKFRDILNNPKFTTGMIINTRREIIQAYLNNTGKFTATQVIDLMTAKERKKYAQYIRDLETSRKLGARRKRYKPGTTVEW